MGTVLEIAEILSKFKVFDTVDDGQVGLYFHFGRVTPRRKRWSKKVLEELAQEERRVSQELGHYSRFFSRDKRPKLPEGFRYDWRGLPKSLKRDEKDTDLLPGFYWLWPVFDSLYTDHNQERTILSKPENMVIVPTNEGGNVAMGYVIIQKIADYERAYTKGDDYEDLLRGMASTLVAKKAGGKSVKEWADPLLYKEIADETLKRLNTFTNNRWGISVEEFSINPVILNPNIHILYGGSQQSPYPNNGTPIKIPGSP